MNRPSIELMTGEEAAEWFRRSTPWLRRQTHLLRLHGPGAMPLYHVGVCRAYVLGRLCGLEGEPLRDLQLRALAIACGFSADDADPAILASWPARLTRAASSG